MMLTYFILLFLTYSILSSLQMPCLRCGCAWWLGEDWNARCARCGWDCEADGYDDDCQPLPKFRAKYDAFCAHIKAGRAPRWSK